MKAICVRTTGGPEVLVLEDLPEPVAGDGQVVVRLHAAGVNPVDVYIRSAAQGRNPVLPYVPGMDGAGVIESVGSNVTGFAPGDRVYLSGTAALPMNGTYAERAVCAPAHVHPLPAHLSFSQGAAVNVAYATAYRSIVDRASAIGGPFGRSQRRAQSARVVEEHEKRIRADGRQALLEPRRDLGVDGVAGGDEGARGGRQANRGQRCEDAYGHGRSPWWVAFTASLRACQRRGCRSRGC